VLGLALRRMWYARKVAGTALDTAWHTPVASKGTDWREASFLVCDAEMSSLNASEGELLSLGWVRIRSGGIELESARHYLIKTRGAPQFTSCVIVNWRRADLNLRFWRFF
jgi:DNA polymerase-3 subunit epsilon